MSNKNFNKILIIGLGLIGGSFARALRKHNATDKIFAFDLNQSSIDAAKELNVIDGFTALTDDISSFDLIVLATPLTKYNEIFSEIADKISPKTILIDLGSIKELKIKTKLPQNLSKNFIPCHPIAGSDKTGFENSTDNLFFDKKFIVCPENCDETSIKKIDNLIKEIGANVEFLPAKKHDEIYALVSHLPQFLSFLTKEFSPAEIGDEFFTKAFRLDNSDPKIWSDIFKLNQRNIEKYYLEFFDNLAESMENLAAFNITSLVMPSKDGIHTDLQHNMDPVMRRGDIGVKFDESFLTKNFAAIFFRAISVTSFLKINDIEKYKSFSGTGFQDFTSITAILNLERNSLSNLIKKHQKEILKIFETLI